MNSYSMLRNLVLLCCSLVGALVNAQCVTTYPNTEPFTSFTVGTPGALANNWANLGGDDLQWNVDDNGTPTANTGPVGDHTTYNTAGKYMVVLASDPGAIPTKSAILESPCFNLTSVSSPYLTFWYHMQGSQMGTLSVDVNVNGVPTTNLWTVSGDQGSAWKQGWLNLAPYGAQTNLRIRFRAITGTGLLSDIAIDDVRLGSLTPVFGCTDATASNYNSAANVNNGTCSYTCPAGQKRVTIDVVADNYPNEISWTLKNASTNTTIASGGSTGTSLCVPENACMIFTMLDSYGDGICCGYGNGAYTLTFDGTVIATGGNYTTQQQTTFNCPPGFSCSNAVTAVVGPVYTAPSLEYWYDFTPASTGSYTITTCGLNTCDTKIWLYDMACAAINPQPGLEGSTFADDNLGGCGLQAVVTGNLAGGTLYHIRLGTNAGSCTGLSYTIIYNGPAVGCMDPASCNYDPLATVSCGGCCIAIGSPNCPDGPDLQMDQPALVSSLNMWTENVTDICAPQEGCVRALGSRQVLRFTTRINNIGELDYYIGSPSSQPQMFSTSNCHGHAHYQGYADYVLFDATGHKIPVGFKNGFCVIDVGCPSGTFHYGCSNMGISAGCYDAYGSGTTCNWIDITDVPDGTYTLVLRTNWDHRPDALGRHETNYTNNYAQVCINLTGFGGTRSFSVASSCPTYTDCLGQPYGDAVYDCTGVCNGTVKTGDLNADSQYNAADPQQYMTDILGNDATTSACTDVNNDGEITVTDAALVAECYNQQGQHDASGTHTIHYHPWCEFPRGFLNTAQTVTLQLANFDPVNKTVDVMVTNPDCRVMGYEFTVSGLTIQNATNLSAQMSGDINMNWSLGGNKVIGLSVVDSSLAKNTVPVQLCRIKYFSLTGTQICISSIQDIVNNDANNVNTVIAGPCLTVTNVVALNTKVFLEGPYNTGTLSMNDNLRTAGLIPTMEPYTSLGFTQAGGGGGEVVNPDVFAVTGANAVVDWVLVELRGTSAPYSIIATKGALLQRDGDIVGLDGTSSVIIQQPPGNYRIAIRHRNHLGVMTNASVALSTSPATVDFRSTTTATYGTQATKAIGANMALWAGNAFRDGSVSLIKYTGTGSDRDVVLQVIGGVIPTNSVTGYYREDVNLDGVVKYTNTANDRDPILLNIGGVVPTNTRTEQLP